MASSHTDGGSGAVAINTGDYHFEGEDATSRPDTTALAQNQLAQNESGALRVNSLAPLRSALTTTRGMR